MPQPTSITWVVLANAGQARVFEERHHGAPLQELTSWDGGATAGEREPPLETEERFLHRFADGLRRAAAAGRYEHLVVIAPPKALGDLKAELGDAAARRIERTEARDAVEQEGPETLRLRLRELRLP